MKISFANKTTQWVTLLGLAFVWGSSFILMKRGLDSFNNNQVAALRIFIAFIAISPFAFKHIKLLKTKAFFPILATGLFGNAIPAFLFTKAQTELSSSFTGMLNSLTPLFTLLIGIIVFKAKTKKVNVIGILIGLIGAIGLITYNGIDFESGNKWFTLFVVGATICYALSVNIIKTYLHHIDSMAITSLAFLTVGPLMIFPLIKTNTLNTIITNENSFVSLGYITILSVFGTSFAVLIFNALIKHTTSLFAASVTYLIPIVAIFWGIIDGENFTFNQFVFITIILAGVYLVNKK